MIWLKLSFAALWPMIWTFGLGTGLIILCLFVAFFSSSIPIIGPFLGGLRKDLIWAAIGIFLAMTFMGIGIKQEHDRCIAQNQIIQNEVNQAVKDATKPSNPPDPFNNKEN